MEIEIINKNPDFFTPQIGEQTTDLLNRFAGKLDKDGIDTLRRETIEILSHCTNPNKDAVQSITNLVVGYVQSGKTMSFTTLSALAHDNGFRIIIYFAGTKNNLLAQTTNKYISALADMFNSSHLKSALGNSGVLIIDDEADQASLNGYAYKNSKSEEWEDDEYTTTYSSILKLRSSLPNHSYIQYTATPQGPLLISIMDLLSPKYHTVLTPGKTYTGGKTFFCDEPGLIVTIPEDEVYHSKHRNLVDCPESLISALQLHLMGVAIVVTINRKEDFLSMMIHADREQDASEKFYGWVKDLLDTWYEHISHGEYDPGYIELKKTFLQTYNEAIRMYKEHYELYPDFATIWEKIPDIILDTNTELLISRNKKQGENKEIDWTGSCSHILVGADMLNRGFTVEHLAITYMPRYSVGKSTADTIQQRCRFFGYKQNYLWSCRVFLPLEAILEYKEYKEYIQREFQYITKDNILFWNLWNISYPFDVLATYKEAYPEEYTLFSEMYFSCWEMLYQVDEKREVLVSVF